MHFRLFGTHLIVLGGALTALARPDSPDVPEARTKDLCAVLCLVLTPILPNCIQLCHKCDKPEAFCPVGKEKSRECVDLTSDTQNCGACGNNCGVGNVCCNSKCVTPSGEPDDPESCGDCGVQCGPDEQCHSGICVAPGTCSSTLSRLQSCKPPGTIGSPCGRRSVDDELCDCMNTLEGTPFCSRFDGQFCDRACRGDEECQQGEACVARDVTCCSQGQELSEGVCFTRCNGGGMV